MCLGLVTYMVFILGLVTGMEGIKFSVKRYRGIDCGCFFCDCGVFVFSIFQADDDSVGLLWANRNSSHSFCTNRVGTFCLYILIGVIFMIIGLVMYEKRAEI